jgi:hypothetical protein
MIVQESDRTRIGWDSPILNGGLDIDATAAPVAAPSTSTSAGTAGRLGIRLDLSLRLLCDERLGADGVGKHIVLILSIGGNEAHNSL